MEAEHDLQFMLLGLPGGLTVRVFIVPANDASEAPTSEAVEMAIP
jgi:hypothetical protein